MAFKGDKEEAKKSVQAILRYLGENPPEAHAIVKDMDAAVARAVTLLSHKIQGGA